MTNLHDTRSYINTLKGERAGKETSITVSESFEALYVDISQAYLSRNDEYAA